MSLLPRAEVVILEEAAFIPGATSAAADDDALIDAFLARHPTAPTRESWLSTITSAHDDVSPDHPPHGSVAVKAIHNAVQPCILRGNNPLEHFDTDAPVAVAILRAYMAHRPQLDDATKGAIVGLALRRACRVEWIPVAERNGPWARLILDRTLADRAVHGMSHDVLVKAEDSLREFAWGQSTNRPRLDPIEAYLRERTSSS
jgi:hypothetical protein